MWLLKFNVMVFTFNVKRPSQNCAFHPNRVSQRMLLGSQAVIT